MTDPSRSRPLLDTHSRARRVEPEILDELPAADPRAQRARRDLQRLNAWMGHARLIARACEPLARLGSAPTILEIGAGDGTLMLRLAERLRGQWPRAKVRLLDRQIQVHDLTLARLRHLGWETSLLQADLFDGLAQMPEVDLIVANLFLHHFEDDALRRFFSLVTRKSRSLVACEPHRFAFPRAAGGMVLLIGCSAVTCHDAIVSIAAGFSGKELSALWPERSLWNVEEGKAGFFSHGFAAWAP